MTVRRRGDQYTGFPLAGFPAGLSKTAWARELAKAAANRVTWLAFTVKTSSSCALTLRSQQACAGIRTSRSRSPEAAVRSLLLDSRAPATPMLRSGLSSQEIRASTMASCPPRMATLSLV